MKTIFKKFGQCNLNGVLFPNGRFITQDEIYQTLLDDPDTIVVTEGDTTRIYDKEGGLLAEKHKL